MEITLIYAIALGSTLVLLLVTNLIPRPPHLTFSTPRLLRRLRYLKYAYIISRHQLLGPWTFVDILLQVIYIISNSFCLGFRVSGIAEAGIRAGNLSLINMVTLFLGPHLSFLADILGISLNTIRVIHRSAAIMSCGLVLFHVFALCVYSTAFSVRGISNISAVVSGSTLGVMTILSWSWSPHRRWFYEIFLRSHQIQAATVAIWALPHVPSGLFPRLYFYISLGIFIATSTYEGVLVLYRNGVLVRAKRRRWPRVGEVYMQPGDEDNKSTLIVDDNRPVQLTIVTQKPVSIEAGQSVNVYLPSLGICSFLQTHPFVVASWTGKHQTKLELIIEPRRGWTKLLQSRAINKSGQSGGLGRVLFTGPHGTIVPVVRYEYVFMVASGYGIVAQLPLLERLVQGTLAREVRARRIRLIWEFEDIGLYKAIYPLLNWVLIEDRKLGANCALAISLYSTQTEPQKPDEKSKRAKFIPEPLSLEDVFRDEIAEIDNRKMQEDEALRKMEENRAEQIERGRKDIFLGELSDQINYDPGALPVCTITPKMLVTVSASARIRDKLRAILRTSLQKEIDLRELDYQP